MKWAATEKVKGVRDYTKGDQIRAKFDSWNIPLSGNTLLWEVDHKATPQWYKNEINSLIDAGEDTEPLSEHVLFHVKERFSLNSEPRIPARIANSQPENLGKVLRCRAKK